MPKKIAKGIQITKPKSMSKKKATEGENSRYDFLRDATARAMKKDE